MSHFPPTIFAGRRFAVVGLGRNGLPAARALTAMGAEVIAWDDNPSARDAASDLVLRDPTPDMARFDALVLSPGIPHRLPAPHRTAAAAIASRVPVLSDVELLFQAVRGAGSPARFAGITGTNGKSTTTALLTHILKTAGLPVAAGANLGPAALGLPLLQTQDAVYALEISSYMLERIASVRFDAAAMLNLSADHIDRHGDMAGYIAAKRSIFHRQGGSDIAVIGIDDAPSRAMAAWLRQGPARVVTVSGDAPADVFCDAGMLRDAGGPILAMLEAPALPGAHNAQDAAAAAALATGLGVARAEIACAIASYPGLPHRQQLVGTVGGIRFINDSKATNADAASRALGCYDRLVWIAGGLGKAGGITKLAPFFSRIAHALLIGRDAPEFARTLAAAGVPHTLVATLDAAVPEAMRRARETGAPVVLLSPAAASFDQFSGFEARGEHFAALVQALAARDGRAA